MSINVVEGDLLEQRVEVIVNAWNRNIIPWWLLLPQGVSGAIAVQGDHSCGGDQHVVAGVGEVDTGVGEKCDGDLPGEEVWVDCVSADRDGVGRISAGEGAGGDDGDVAELWRCEGGRFRLVSEVPAEFGGPADKRTTHGKRRSISEPGSRVISWIRIIVVSKA
jgi:hypothetical protein